MTGLLYVLAGALVLAIGAAIAAGVKALALAGQLGDARVEAQTLSGKLAISTSDTATQKNRADAEQRRGDALDDALDDAATSGDAAGVRSRVLTKWIRARDHADAADHDLSHGVFAPPTPTPTGPDELLKPGD